MHRSIHIARGLRVACIVVLLWPQVTCSQVDPTPSKTLSSGSQPRTVSLAVTMGALELMSAGGRWSSFFSRPGEDDFLFLNALTVDCQYLRPANGVSLYHLFQNRTPEDNPS